MGLGRCHGWYFDSFVYKEAYARSIFSVQNLNFDNFGDFRKKWAYKIFVNGNIFLFILFFFGGGGGGVTIQNGWNNRISYGCVYAQIRSGILSHDE